MIVDAVADERAIYELYLAGFERVFQKTRPWTVMCSYNRVKGLHASENKWLLTDVLRTRFGFQGLVMSDWGAVNDRVPRRFRRTRPGNAVCRQVSRPPD